MNREILFRGKRVDNGEWVYGYYLFVSNKYHQILSGKWHRASGSPYSYEVIPSTVGQFTGLTDKKGNKIFEGDVLCGTDGLSFHVYWDECSWQINNSHLYERVAKRKLITSNIHDNPTT